MAQPNAALMERDTADLPTTILDRLAEGIRWQGQGTRYAVIDGLLPDWMAHAIHSGFPARGAGFSVQRSFRESKRTTHDLDRFLTLKDAAYAFQAPAVVDLIGQAVGMGGLETDPSLYAGGPSLMLRGDFLNPHIDNSHDAGGRRYRRLNLLYYVTPDWQARDGGVFELWDGRISKAVTIEPRFNRLVIMETNRASWHSVSPITADRARCCISAYYFSKRSPTGADYSHITSFTGRPEEPTKRLLAPIDNTARRFARKVLRMTRAGEGGYHATVPTNDHVPGEPAVVQTQ